MFEEIIGNDKAKETLSKMIENKSLVHSYLFTGNSTVDKFLVAKEFAKRALCTGDDNCNSCIKFNSNNHPDFKIVSSNVDSIKISQIREMIGKVLEKPIVSDKKIYIINHAELMTKEAQNALLKTLEEPPQYVLIILITSNEELILNTIKSRCMKIPFTSKVISKELSSEYLEIEKIFLGLEGLSKIDIIKKNEKLYKAKEEIYDILDYINVILLNIAKRNTKYLNCINIVEKAKLRLKQNANYDMTLDNMLFEIWEEVTA